MAAGPDQVDDAPYGRIGLDFVFSRRLGKRLEYRPDVVPAVVIVAECDHSCRQGRPIAETSKDSVARKRRVGPSVHLTLGVRGEATKFSGQLGECTQDCIFIEGLGEHVRLEAGLADRIAPSDPVATQPVVLRDAGRVPESLPAQWDAAVAFGAPSDFVEDFGLLDHEAQA
jgi:hypothetical protein